MKIQFLMKCEQVHEGLYRLLGRAPSIVEWANACGFKEEDPVRSRPDYQETEVETQLRPVKSEAWDEEQDPNMFIGNGLAYDTGPGRGRGRAKKTPPTSLKDYYDDSDSKFCHDQKKTVKKIPINRGTPQDFIDMMLIGKEAKQKMVQSNMRLVVSISKRYKHVGVNVADLVQEGSIGLTRAAEKFDPKKGFKFSTYASW
jgi:DNA-directed RNA polymerase sigma subunit (sigma70/sigma32)